MRLFVFLMLVCALLIQGCEKDDPSTCWRCEVRHYEIMITLNGKPLYGWRDKPERIYCEDDGYTLKGIEKDNDTWRIKCYSLKVI